jgi:hypothetical protein
VKYVANSVGSAELAADHFRGHELTPTIRSTHPKQALEIELARAAIQSDFETLAQRVSGNFQQLGETVDPSEEGLLGPYWDEQIPDWYREGSHEGKRVFFNSCKTSDFLRTLCQALAERPDDRWIAASICSIPLAISRRFESARDFEAFFRKNILDESNIFLSLTFNMASGQRPDVSRIALIALYPTQSICSVSATLTLPPHAHISAEIDDPGLFLDPGEEESDEYISAFRGRVTLFAVDCGEP